MDQYLARLEAVATRLEKVANISPNEQAPVASAPASSSSAASPKSVTAYQEFIDQSFGNFQKYSNLIGGDVQSVAALFNKGFAAQKAYLNMASKCKKPADSELMSLITPQSTAINEIQKFRDTHPRTDFRDHLSACNELAAIYGWILQPKPISYIAETRDSSIFWSNKVLKKYKGEDENHVEWCKSVSKLANDLSAYVKEYHTTGVVWNANGEKASVALLSDKPAVAPKPKGQPGPPAPPGPPGPPGPPPPAAPGPPSNDNTTKQANAGAALFAEINSKGSGGITAHLKKVPRGEDGKRIKTKDGVSKSDDQLADSAAAASKKQAAAKKPTAAAATATVKPPRFEKVDKKWFVEHQIGTAKDGNITINIPDVEKNQQILLFKCERTNVIITGKCNNISVNNCKKTNIVFDDAICGIEIVNCQSIKAQANGRVSNVQVDKTDGFQCYLSKESVEAQIISAKSSEMNVTIMDNDGEWVEQPLPEQFKTFYDQEKKKWLTVTNEN